MKKLILSLVLVLGVFAAKAQTTFTTSFTIGTATTITNLLAFGAKVTRIVVNAGVGNAATYNYAFLDAPYTNGVGEINPRRYHFSGYTNWLSYKTNYARPTTNYDGVTNTLVFSNVLVTVPQAVSASSNTFSTLVSGSTTASNTVTLDYANSPLMAAFGLTFTNIAANTSVTVTVTFDPSL